jgi:hypothetical protein
MIIKPLPDAIHLSLHGEKLARITLKELEEVSVEEQEKSARETQKSSLIPPSTSSLGGRRRG